MDSRKDAKQKASRLPRRSSSGTAAPVQDTGTLLQRTNTTQQAPSSRKDLDKKGSYLPRRPDNPPAVSFSRTADDVLALADNFTFDGGRLRMSMYGDLEDINKKVDFMKTIEDYMDYARRRAKAGGPVTPSESAAMEEFLAMVDDDNRWDLAVPLVPEFQELGDAPNPDQPSPLSRILEKVRPRIRSGEEVQLKEIMETQRLQEDMIWQRCKTMIEYIGWLEGEAYQTPSDRLKEVAGTVDLAQVAGVVEGRAKVELNFQTKDTAE